MSFFRIVIGVVMIIAAGSKATDIVGLTRQIDQLLHITGILDHSNVPVSLYYYLASILLFVEFLLGFCLVTGYKLRLASTILIIVLSSFTFLHILLLATNGDVNCGCFGALFTESPLIATAENILLILLLILLLRSNYDIYSKNPVPLLALITLSIIWTAIFYIKPPSWAALRPGMVWNVESVATPRKTEKTLYWYFDPNCHDCQVGLGKLDQLVSRHMGVDIYGVTSASHGRISEFVYDFDPSFLIIHADSSVIVTWRLPVGSLIYVVNDKIAEIWPSDKIPDYREFNKLLK